MRKFFYVCIMNFALLFFPLALNAGEAAPLKETFSHDLEVTLFPGEHRVSAKDTITVPDSSHKEFHFLLHGGLKPFSLTPGVIITRETDDHGKNLIESYRAVLTEGLKSFTLEYKGTIYHPIDDQGKDQARGFNQSPGIISEQGIYLSGSSFWYPVFDGALITFKLQVKLPSEWDAVSQGERIRYIKDVDKTLVLWESAELQDEIFLVASRFTGYLRQTGKVTSMVFLRTPDEDLANKYLEATSKYIAMYDKLIGPYPYKKFALVENFWETGFGMPSFTLLGPTVIRLPFIINSSYPHEILHNWWGNSVFPEYSSGNWSEGLTAYLSDYLIVEQQGLASEYRQTTLQKYADYVLSGSEFPLNEFQSRHSASSEAIGYGKSLMFFHILRRELGDKTFTSGLQDFYKRNKFSFASFDGLRESFEKVSKKNLQAEFDQWVSRTGAPMIKLAGTKAENEGAGYGLDLVLEQVQPEAAYILQIPVAVTMEGEEKALQTVVKMDKKSIGQHLHLPSRPERVDLDPEFDLFRRLDRSETPPAVSQALGAKKMLVVLPSSADHAMLGAYRELSKMLMRSGPAEVEVRLDTDIKELPSDRAVTVLGWGNRFLDSMISMLSGYDLELVRKNIRIGKTELTGGNYSLVVTGRNPWNKEFAVMFIAAESTAALPGLGRKLPHYHKYSYLVFEGDEPVNRVRGRWPVLDSPMTAFIPSVDGKIVKKAMASLAARLPLAVLPPDFSKERMLRTVSFLTQPQLKGRGLGTEGLDRAAEYIAEKFREAGLEPAGAEKGSYFQAWEENVVGLGHGIKMKNVVGVIPGKKKEFSDQSVVIGAHYDHLGLGWPDVRDENRGKVHPGADDNAGGVAVIIELAAELKKNLNPERSLVFVAFTGEEAGRLGSLHYVAHERRYPAARCIGMLNLDTVGRLGRKKLLVLGAGSAREWPHIFSGASFITGVELETVSGELDSSDQVSFADAGVPAIQLFSGPHADYHRPTDTLDKIDPEGLEKVASVANEVIEYLAARDGALTVSIKPDKKEDYSPKPGRKVSLGVIPDYAYNGRGCRITGVMPGTPAEAGGLKEGDVIVRINSDTVSSMKEFSDVLKSLSPGSKIRISFLRDGAEMTTEADLKGK
jgi:aminopeptidase N